MRAEQTGASWNDMVPWLIRLEGDGPEVLIARRRQGGALSDQLRPEHPGEHESIFGEIKCIDC